MKNDETLTNEKKKKFNKLLNLWIKNNNIKLMLLKNLKKEIMDNILEFKLNWFKNDSRIQLLEEKVKLNIYSLINEAFYWNKLFIFLVYFII